MSEDASEHIASLIRARVESQGLRPGDRIGTEQELAESFGVSRPTLREALRLLAAGQLIRVGRGRAGGIFVARTPSEGMSRSVSESISLMLAARSVTMAELLDARLSLEVPIAGRAARNADAGVADRLEEAVRVRRISADVDPGAILDQHSAVLCALCAADSTRRPSAPCASTSTT